VVDLPRLTIGKRQASYLSFGDFNLLGQRVEYRRVYGRQQSLVPFISARQSAWVAMLSTGDPAQQHQGLLIEVTYLPYGQTLFFSMPVIIKIKQVAQLSQRDRAAGCVIVFAKSRTL